MRTEEESAVSEIRRVRMKQGLSMRQLADRLHVTPAAVQQYEKSEALGTIHLSTLRKALAAMDADLTLSAKIRKSPVRRLTLPAAVLRSAPKPHRPKDRVIFRAKSRVRTGAIIADSVMEHLPFTPSELWAIVDGATVGGRPIAAQRRVRDIRDGYDTMVRAVAAGQTPRPLVTPDGVEVSPDETIAEPFARAVDLAVRAVAGGVGPVEARRAANAELLANGLDAVVLMTKDRERHDVAIEAIRQWHDAAPFTQLMLDRYSEDD